MTAFTIHTIDEEGRPRDYPATDRDIGQMVSLIGDIIRRRIPGTIYHTCIRTYSVRKTETRIQGGTY